MALARRTADLAPVAAVVHLFAPVASRRRRPPHLPTSLRRRILAWVPLAAGWIPDEGHPAREEGGVASERDVVEAERLGCPVTIPVDELCCGECSLASPSRTQTTRCRPPARHHHHHRHFRPRCSHGQPRQRHRHRSRPLA